MIGAPPVYLRRGESLSLPAPWPEIRLIAALGEYPAARHLAKRLGLDTDCLSCDFSRQLARALLDGLALPDWIGGGLHYRDGDCPVSWKGAIAVCYMIDGGTATDAEAIAAVRLLVDAQDRKRLAEQFRWAAGAVERDNPRDDQDLDATRQAADCLRRVAI